MQHWGIFAIWTLLTERAPVIRALWDLVAFRRRYPGVPLPSGVLVPVAVGIKTFSMLVLAGADMEALRVL